MPDSVRARMSRFTSSVPSQWAALGPTRLAPAICCVGEYGVSSGPTTPSTTTAATSSTPSSPRPRSSVAFRS